MEISIEKKQIYSEVYELINLLDIEYIDKIPIKLFNFFKNNRDINYKKNINPFEDIKKQNLKKDTIIIFSILNLKYFANDEEKIRLKKLYKMNQEKINEKYSYDNLFKQDNNNYYYNILRNNQNTQLVTINNNQNVLKKIINLIKKFFKK